MRASLGKSFLGLMVGVVIMRVLIGCLDIWGGKPEVRVLGLLI